MNNESIGTACRIKKGWADAGKEGSYFGKHWIGGRFWAVVLWEDEEEPELFKADAIEVSTITYVQP